MNYSMQHAKKYLAKIDQDLATKRGPGRPATKDRAPDGQPARVRLVWFSQSENGQRVENFSSAEAALKLLGAWARRDCVPPNLRVERKGAAGWVDA